ncbi:MAG TPA: ABC transporter permease subunit [Geminicoccaceae bacterium]|nr:ABC transporter permease subunit [Geminicoccus sp.]HMU52906.1 ABC transporter permease subunit [Geminicoccaceae bacterium]
MSAPSPTDDGSVGGERLLGILLVLPALATVALLFLYPLSSSFVLAFADPAGGWSWANFHKAFELYGYDIGFTLVIVGLSVAWVALLSVAIGGYLTLGECAPAVAALRWLYRWPLFIPFIVAAQTMRSFLAKNGLMNHALTGIGLIEPIQAQSLLDWRGVVVTFVWKQTPFVALMVAGAMASLDRSLTEAARNLGAGRLRILMGIVLPLVRQPLLVGLVLSFVTMMSVLSVPVMINAGSPTLITVDMAFRITAYGDYPVANALGTISCLMTGAVAWIYLRHGVRRGGGT